MIGSTTLDATTLGADVLRDIATRRGTGVLRWKVEERDLCIWFVQGRPEASSGADGKRARDKARISQAVRTFATAAEGETSWVADDAAPETSLGVDTLGETLVALLHTLNDATLSRAVAARSGRTVQASPTFGRVSRAVAASRGPQLETPVPQLFSALTGTEDRAVVRAWLAVLVLGGLEDGIAPEPSPEADVTSAAPSAHAPTADAKEHGVPYPPLPQERLALELALEIKTAHRALQKQTHYELLNVKTDAGPEQVKAAYFAAAKRWHADRFSGVAMGAYVGLANEIFRACDEASKVLSDPEKKSDYDFVLDRIAKGLPTDVNAILEAEAIFKKAQGLIRRGGGVEAEPLLRRAIELNPGEPDFFIYHGFALYAAHGHEKVVEARARIREGQQKKDKSDVALEFLGKIARSENELDSAATLLKRALETNPKNVEAERELRLVLRRSQKDKEGSGGFLSKLLKK